MPGFEMKRREFITLLGGAATAPMIWPRSARAQQDGSVARVGVIGPPLDYPAMRVAYPFFLAELRKLGFVEGRNLLVESRPVDESVPRVFAAANELVAWKADVLFAFGPELALQAAAAARPPVPIVMGAAAPTAGTGKSLLVDIVAMLALGQRMPVISQGKNEEELEKRLGAALLAGDLAISLDNCEHQLRGGFLCQVLTQTRLNIRLLGFSKIIETPVNAALYATGNNLTVAGDLVRRTLLCSLDAHCERPELRSFNEDPIETVRAERGKLVAAVLTILRAWHVADERLSVPPFGGFEIWSRRIRKALIWLGAEDPCKTAIKVRSGDPEREALQAVVTQWREHLGTEKAFTVQQVINRATAEEDFQTALLNVAASRAGNAVSNDRLGRWLKTVEGKIIDKLALKQEGSTNGYPLWHLTEVGLGGLL